PAAQRGKAIGLILGGTYTMVSGAGGEILGGAATATGVGAAVGVPAIVVSTGMVLGGAANVYTGVQSLRAGPKEGGAASPAAASGRAGRATGMKRGPKSDPSAPHNAKIRSEAEALEGRGNTVVAGGGRAKELVVKTPGGHRSARRPDIVYETSDGALRGRNVGRTRSDGSPVKREVEALEDLNGPGGLPTDFVPYDR
ncbi:MAG: hypothetical protein R3B70_36105, partial [Polyangiaceae bacterium]